MTDSVLFRWGTESLPSASEPVCCPLVQLDFPAKKARTGQRSTLVRYRAVDENGGPELTSVDVETALADSSLTKA